MRGPSTAVIQLSDYGQIPTIDHFAREFPAPAGEAYARGTQATGHVKRTKTYAQLSFSEAARKCDSYAQCALHMFFKADRRLQKEGGSPPAGHPADGQTDHHGRN